MMLEFDYIRIERSTATDRYNVACDGIESCCLRPYEAYEEVVRKMFGSEENRLQYQHDLRQHRIAELQQRVERDNAELESLIGT